ncbi:hypothetical protein RUND412_002226 [Rhizina undulata]
MDHEISEILEDAPESCPRGFRILYEKTLPHHARPNLAAWSPQLDLIVLVTTNENVLLYRMNGQRVWGFAPKHANEATIEHLHWRPDGKMLALGYSDGSTRIHDVNNGKPIHRIASEVPGFGKVTCVGWVDNYSHSKPRPQDPDAAPGESSPQGLFDLDLGQMLPRLSSLPTSSGPESAFSSKATLDALVNAVAKGSEVNHLDVLLIGERGGKILLNVYNSFVIGTIELTSLSQHIAPGTKLIRHTASSDLSTHSLLLSDSRDNLLFSTMDILFIQQFGQYLFQLASISTRVHATIRYIRETVTTLESEFKTMNDLAQRYVNIIDEDARKVGSEAELELFEILVTGLPTQILREWLVDVLQERNQKRWEKSSISGYESLRKLVHENLLPACERLTVLFCRLRGLARWKERGSPLGLDPDDFTRCLDVVSGLTVFSHYFISKLNKELELFTAFASWLRHTLDELSTVINIEDKPAEDPQIDTLKVAEYVSGYLHQSSLQPFFQRGAAMKLSEYKEKGESIFELYSKGESTEKGQGRNPPGFMALAQYLDELCKMVFSKPQQAMRQQLRTCKPILIAEKEPVKGDVRMFEEEGKTFTYMVFYHGDDSANTLILIRCEIAVAGGLSTVANIGCAKVLFSRDPESRLVHLQFVDDSAIMLIVADKDAQSREMLMAIYNTVSYDFDYDAEDLGDSVCSYAEGLPGQEMEIVSRRTFDASFVPAEVTVNGTKSRRVGCVIGEDQVRYKVFDIDQEEPEDDAQEDDEKVEEQENEEEMEVDDER